MELENLLKDLIKNEDIKMKKYILFMLLKFSELVEITEDDKDYLPLLIVKNEKILLVYKDEDLDDFEYIFSDYEEILIILQKTFNDNNSIYFYHEAPEDLLSHEEIIDKINESIEKNDEEMFKLYSSKLN